MSQFRQMPLILRRNAIPPQLVIIGSKIRKMKYDNILITNFTGNSKPSILAHRDSLCHCALVAINEKLATKTLCH